MYIYRKELLFPVQATNRNPAYAAAVLEQFGGANGELKALTQVLKQKEYLQNQQPFEEYFQ